MSNFFDSALSAVRLALGDAAQKASNRHLTVYQNNISCKPGCNGCCSRLLYVSIAEAVVIVNHLKEDGTWPAVREKATQQFRISQEASPVSWLKMNIKCPVLGSDGMCQAYPVRPVLCSTHFVTSDPAGCDPWSTKDVDYQSVNMTDLYLEFQKRLESHVAGHGIMSVTAPIPVALLLAERIQTKTTMDLQQVVSLVYNEFK